MRRRTLLTGGRVPAAGGVLPMIVGGLMLESSVSQATTLCRNRNAVAAEVVFNRAW
jgi:hypothetical protein